MGNLSKALLLASLFIMFAVSTSIGAETSSCLSPLALAADATSGKLYVAESTAHQIAMFDTRAAKVQKTFRLPLPPTGLALSRDGATLYVTGKSPNGLVFVLSTKTGKIAARIRVGHTPMSPVLAPDGKTLYVCNRFDNNVSVIDLKAKRELGAVSVSREPVAAALTLDGKRLFVANQLPAGPADGDYAAAAISVVDVPLRKTIKDISLPNGSTDMHGICISPDGKYVYATHVLARYHMPTTQLERGWMNTNALTVVDAEKATAVNTVLLDSVDLGAANPWGVACTADGKWLCVAHAGTHEVSVIDLAKLHAKLNKVAAGKRVTEVSRTPEDVPNDLSFLVDVRRRLPLAGKGPRGVATIGAKLYAAEYFSDSLGVVDLANQDYYRPKSLALGPKPQPSVVRRGEMLFHDATMCFQHWQSCTSCHPDARSDGLNWDLLNDGMGNPKQTKSLLLAHKTPPAMVSGVRGTAEAAVRAGIRYILFAVRPESDAAAIDEYLKSLKPVPSPFRVSSQFRESIARGERLFQEAGCSACHPAPLYTDKCQHDVGTGKGLDGKRKFDTPTLVEVWRTAPYLYDGRAPTLKAVLTEYNRDNMHGNTAGLTPKQIGDLVAFVLSR